MKTPPPPPPPPPSPPEAPGKLERPAPPPSEKLPPPPIVEFPEPQHLSQDQIMLGMAEEFGIIAQRRWSEMERFECSVLCTRAIKYILQKPLREAVRSLGFKVMIAPLSIAVKSETILGKVMKEAVVHLLGLVEKRFDISAYLPDALLSKLFDIIFPGLSAELASTLAEATGGVERLEEKVCTRALEDYFKRQNPKVIQVKQSVRFSARETGFHECLCKVDGFILYYPYTRYAVGVFKCLCGRGPPKLITINYKTNKYGYSEGPVETDERELPQDTPIEAG